MASSMTDFAQVVNPAASIHGILRQYALGTGLLRELLQNSDDAGASKQIFVLDYRTHKQGTGFASGPALLAYNDALVTDLDWQGLQNINASAKTGNSNTTGKYGLGFRSTFHVTDTPEILSGRYLATFDPLRKVLHTTGVRREFVGVRALSSHLSTFSSVTESSKPHRHVYNATAIRLPLRCADLSEDHFGSPVSVEELRELLEKFIRDEMATAILFLRNVTSIVVRIVAASGETSTLASAQLQKSMPIRVHGAVSREFTVERSLPSDHQLSRWLHVACETDGSQLVRELASRLGRVSDEHVARIQDQLERDKLVPDVGIAFPLESSTKVTGRLYTYLPLPITTGFPFHINGAFALTSDRQSLINPEETGTTNSAHRFQVEWNRLLFTIAIPSAWSALLRVGVDRGVNVFDLWARSVPSSEARGQATYWNDVPVDLAQLLWTMSLPVWPVSQRKAMIALSEEVLVTSEPDAPHVQALADVGLKICCMPAHVLAILRLAKLPLSDLSPETAHPRLLARPEPLYNVPLTPSGSATRRAVLDFLLISRPINNIVGLPLIPLASDPDVSFAAEIAPEIGPGITPELTPKRSARVECYIFDDKQAAVFGSTSPVFYALSGDLPRIFTTVPLSRYNLRRPSHTHIVNLVENALVDLQHEGDPIPWAIKLWEWISGLSEEKRVAYVEALSPLATVPTSNEGLCRASFGIYLISDETRAPGLQALLNRGGIFFLHPSVPSAPLEECGLVRSIRDAPLLITSGSLKRATHMHTSDSEAEALMELLADILSTSPHKESLCSGLRELPIYPVISAGGLNVSTERQRIPTDVTVFVVPRDLDVVLPVVPDTYFVPSSLPRIVAQSIGAQDAPLTLLGALQLALDNFSNQTTTLQATVVHRMAKEKESIPQNLISKLGQICFVSVAAGDSTACPCDVIKPRSPLSSLFPADSQRIAQRSSPERRRVVKSLAKLGLLATELTPDFANECIDRIASDPANPAHFQCATTLLHMLDTGSMDMSLIKIDDAQCWIPCEGNSLRNRIDCRDVSDEKHHHHDLFDRVLGVSTVCVTSQALRERLNWHRPIPTTVIKQQFKLCVNDNNLAPDVMRNLISELALRRLELSEDDLEELRSAVAGRRWVPVDGELHSETHVVFDLPIPLPPFCQLDTRSTAKRSFLLDMGCSQRPSTQSILDALQSLQDSANAGNEVDIDRAVSLLKVLFVDSLSASQLSQLPVPADDQRLYPCEHVHYNDMPLQAYSLKLPNNAHRAHSHVGPELAGRLRLSPLSKLYLHEQYDEEDMGEPLSTRVSNVLSQYQREQMPTEFLANAIDAGATSVSFTIDEADFSTAIESLLNADLAEFQMGGSIIVHNNAVFRDDDWLGLKHVGRGSKRGRTDSIGRFGLGALAAYHFSEVVMVISGEFFLLLDPSRSYLGGGRASRQIKLENMHMFFRDHLRPFYGLHDFTEGDKFYEGTLFRLPLRTLPQAARSELCQVSLGVTDARLLLDRYSEGGKLAALFVPALVSLGAFRRTILVNDGQISTCTPLWTLEVARPTKIMAAVTLPRTETAFVRLRVRFPASEISEDWETYRQSLELSASEQRLQERYRLPNTVSVGVALRSDKAATAPSSRLFSHLPLPISTALPFHVHASFIMAEDRRAIRLDETSLEDSESSFNRDLLSTYVPNLYLEALHHIVANRSLLDDNLWPSANTLLDAPSRLVANGLYSLLASDGRLVCESVSGIRIAPSSIIYADHRVPEDVRRVLELLAPPNCVLGPDALEHTDVPRVSAHFVRSVLTSSAPAFQDIFDSAQVTIAMVASLVQYLMDGDPSGELLHGLRLLPLADGALTLFDRESQPVFSLAEALRPALIGDDAPWHVVFPADRFVHPDVPSELQDGLLSAHAQIHLFDDDAISQLMRSRVLASPKRVLSQRDADWLAAFWGLYPLLRSSDVIHKDLLDLPLLPVLSSEERRFISLHSCGDPDVIFKATTSSLTALGALQTMGASIVDKPSLPEVLKQYEPIQSSSFTLSGVLKFLQLGAHERFELLGDAQATDFRDWLKGQLCRRQTSLSPEDLKIARTLPLLPVRNTASFLAPDEIVMLPAFIRLDDVLPFTPASCRLTDYDREVERAFSIEPVSILDLCSVIAEGQDAGQAIPAHDLPAYRNLLDAVLGAPEVIANGLSALKIPNVDRIYVSADELYARSVELFVSIFDVEGRRPNAFVHPELAALEGRMHRLRLKTEVDVYAFGECVRTVHNATDAGQLDSAILVYTFYGTQLPFLRSVNWSFFDDFRFVPRNPERRRLRPELSAYANDLPLVISPNEVILPEYESIAWSQRGRLMEAPGPPSPRVLIERPNFGKPTIEEVVQHLYVLKGIGQDLPHDPAVVTDVRASYAFLQANLDELPDPVKITLRNAELFLNIDDRNSVWQWCSPSSMILNAPDDGQDYKMVRNGLTSYARLLIHLGTIPIVDADAPAVQLTGPEDSLQRLRASFQEKRQKKVAVDIVFVDADQPPGRHLAHRIFLAACASQFEDAFFKSGMLEASTTSSGPFEIEMECGGEAIEGCLDFFYTGTYGRIEHENLQILFDMLYLADYWDAEDFKATIERDLATHLSPNVYESVREYAVLYHADALVQTCKQWEERNQAALRRVGSG